VRIKLKLSEQDNMQKLAFFGFQIGKQAQGFECGHRHRLRFVNTEDDTLFSARLVEQGFIDLSYQMILIKPGCFSNIQFLGDGQKQGICVKIGVGKIGGDPARIKGLQWFSAKQCLAGADVTADLDEAFALAERQNQGVERFLMILY
jgi:hypothetical protein